MPFGYGGGIRNLDDMNELFKLGVEKVIVNSHAIEDPSFIRKAATLFGSQSVVVSIDVKKGLFGKYAVYDHCSGRNTKLDPVIFARTMADEGAGEIFLTSVDRDGTMEGYDLDLIKKVSEAVSVPVIACGGAGTTAHFREAVSQGGVSAVSAGSMFVFYGKHRAVLISYPSISELEQIVP
jgi:cyclase